MKTAQFDPIALAKRKKRQETLHFVLRLLAGICFMSPIFIAIAFSFLPNEILDGVPQISDFFNYFTLENYRDVLSIVPMFRYVTNSLVMCVIVITVQVIVACLAAYAFGMFEFRGKNFFFTIVLIGMMIPGQVVTIANFLTVRDAGLINTYLGLCLPSLITGAAIFLMRQFFMTLPKELKEASLIDGCSDMRFLFSIAIPLAIPSIAALAIQVFIGTYNAYLWPLLAARDQSMFTVQVGMSMLVDADATQFGRVLAGAVLSIIIPVIAFIIGQNYLIKGMTAGAVKG